MFGVSDQLVKLNDVVQNFSITGKFLCKCNKKIYSLNYDVKPLILLFRIN